MRSRTRSNFHFATPFTLNVHKPSANGVMETIENNSRTISHRLAHTLRMNEMGHLDGGMKITKDAFTTTLQRIGVKTSYMNEVIKTNPRLAADIFNHGVSRILPKDYQAVIHQDYVDGIIGDNYVHVPSKDLVNDLLQRSQADTIAALNIEGTKVRMDVTLRDRSFEPQKGDIVAQGWTMRNSEDGRWAVELSSYLLRLVCTNGMIARAGDGGNGMASSHRGAVQERISDFFKSPINLDSIFHRIQESVRKPLGREDLNYLSDQTEEELGSLSMANVARAHAHEQSKFYGRSQPALYDYWNGITHVANTVDGMERRLDIQTYANTILDYQPSAN